MAQLCRSLRPSLTTLLHLYNTHLASRRGCRVLGGSCRKGSILVGFGGCVRHCSLESSSTHDSDTPFVRCTTVIRDILRSGRSGHELESDLNKCELPLCEELVLDVLRSHRWEWKSAYSFFNWSLSRRGYTHGSRVYNEMLDILGRAKKIDLMCKVFDEMSKWGGRPLVNVATFAILSNRYAGAHRVQEAIDLLYKRKEFGLEVDVAAFQTLLLSLCRYKHVEEAETLFLQKRLEFSPDIKSWNIILNGWCVMGSYREAKRVWKDILNSECKPDLFTYGTFINSLSKAGKLSTALEVFNGMWEKGCHPDVAICNCVIDALCFKKKIPDALQIFTEMSERGCLPNIATYNTLVKYICKIGRMEKSYELLNEMKKKGHLPNTKTFAPFLRAAKNPQEIGKVLDRMKGSKCEIDNDTYNLVLSLYARFDHPKGVKKVWSEMEMKGLGPDCRSYTICIHWLYSKGRLDQAMEYFSEMQSKGMVIETRTMLMIKEIESKRNEPKPDDQHMPSSNGNFLKPSEVSNGT